MMENSTLSTYNEFNNHNNTLSVARVIYQLIAIIQLPIEIFGLFSNLYLLAVIIYGKGMRSPAYICIGNMAVSNIMMIVSFSFMTWGRYKASVARNFTHEVQKSFLHVFICKLIVPMLISTFIITNLSIVLITFERYKAIAASQSEKLKRNQIFMLIVAIWLLSILLIWPRNITSGPPLSIKHLCGLMSSRLTIQMLIISSAAFIYLLQLITILYCYPRILSKLRNRSLTPMTPEKLSRRLKQHRLSRVELFRVEKNKSIVAMFQISFILQILSDAACLLFLIIITLFNQVMSILAIAIIFGLLCLSMLAVSVYHPIIYIIHMKKFKDPLRSTFTGCFSCSRLSNRISPQLIRSLRHLDRDQHLMNA